MATIKIKYLDSVLLNKHSSIWCVGDVHGCADEFDVICQQIRKRDSKATIYQVGDLIDRGPYFSEVFDVVRKYDVQMVIGNHEYSFLTEHRGIRRVRSKARQISHEKFAALTQTEQDDILRLMQTSKNYVEIWGGDSNNFVIAHAPLVNGELKYVNIAARDYCFNSQPAVKNKYGYYVQVFGHEHWAYTDIADQVKENVGFYNVDAGCVYGKDLVALELKSLDFIKVKAKMVYFVDNQRSSK